MAVASLLGAIMVTGCAQPRFASTDIQFEDVSQAPVDQIKKRPDTHPEWRTGLWHFPYTDLKVIETTVLKAPAGEYDTTYLMDYNPEIINVAMNVPGEGAIIYEAAGSEMDSIRETHQSPWPRFWMKGK